MNNSVFLLCFFVVICLTTVTQAGLTKKYHRKSAPAPWTLEARAPRDFQVEAYIALQQRNIRYLKLWLELDSDPDSPFFGQHKTRDEILSLIEPSANVQKDVLEWIGLHSRRYSGVKVENLRDAVKITGPVAFMESLFQTEMYVFVDSVSGHRVIKHLNDLHVPEELNVHIELIAGITEFPPVSLVEPLKPELKQTRQSSADNQCNVAYNIKNLYKIPQTASITQTGTNITIFRTLGGQPRPMGFGAPDLLYYQKALGLPEKQIECIIGDASNSYTTNQTDGEGVLDTQLATTMAPGVTICYYITKGWIYEFSSYLFNTPGSPVVASMSVAFYEDQQCYGNISNCPAYHIPNYKVYIERVNTEFAKLGLQGHTIVVSSGNGGTAGPQRSENNCTALGPLFPASSPYVVTVGATSIEASNMRQYKPLKPPPVCTDSLYQCNCSTSTNEQIATQFNTAGFDTGGGFSSFIPQPQYQRRAVQEYLHASGVPFPPSNLFNPNNRAYPDIGAVGENICLMNAAYRICVKTGGTSASAPIIAGMISLLNNDRLAAGKKTLGQFTPLIYKMYYTNRDRYFKSDFAQVSNPGECAGEGFYSNPQGGWSPLVGVGSPKFDQIRKFVASLP